MVAWRLRVHGGVGDGGGDPNPDPDPDPPASDFTVTTRDELNALLGSGGSTDLSNKTIYIAGDCTGAEITIQNRTWPGLTIQGASADSLGLLPRLRFINVKGASGNPITFKWTENYAVATSAAQNGEGIVTFEGGTPSDYITFEDFEVHDDPFESKPAGWPATGVPIFRGFASEGNGSCNHLTLRRGVIYNVFRSVIWGDDLLAEDCDWHDHYQHAATILGSRQTWRRHRCWNLWAAGTDFGSPHAGNSFSPQPTGDSDCEDVLIEGVVAIPGVARVNFDGKFPIASGIKFNDMSQTGFKNRRCVVRNCLLVGTDTQMGYLDGGVDCVWEWNTLVHDEAQNGTNKPGLDLDNNVNVSVRNNIAYQMIAELDDSTTRGDLQAWNNGNAKPDDATSTSILRYVSVFAGSSFSLIETCEEALAAFALDPSHPMASWDVTPGAVNPYYDWETGVGDWPDNARPVSDNETAQTTSVVTKPNSAWLRTKVFSGGSAWVPASKRQGVAVFRVAATSAMDGANRNAIAFQGQGGGTRAQVLRLSSKYIELELSDGSNSPVLRAVGSRWQFPADGSTITVVFAWDMDQAKVQLAFIYDGVAYLDWPQVDVLRSTDWSSNTCNQITVGAGSTGTPTGSAWIGDMDTCAMDGVFTDLWTDEGFSKFFNTDDGLADLGAGGANVTGSAMGIYLRGDAAAWNGASGAPGGTSLNEGSGQTSTGEATKFNKGGTGSFS